MCHFWCIFIKVTLFFSLLNELDLLDIRFLTIKTIKKDSKSNDFIHPLCFNLQTHTGICQYFLLHSYKKKAKVKML